ncbi:hypothetical protein L1987_49473 [Smallanthus sonchifolius]|uniref:Uncharacterized protein n=1 Tax=Smallanthus sonchifolius TaxID=185202 RepID=A0ACB9FVP1_9ASTR|nr:hypothetical protein L1987_49473 [Smallanthus sonchifolius]
MPPPGGAELWCGDGGRGSGGGGRAMVVVAVAELWGGGGDLVHSSTPDELQPPPPPTLELRCLLFGVACSVSSAASSASPSSLDVIVLDVRGIELQNHVL